MRDRAARGESVLCAAMVGRDREFDGLRAGLDAAGDGHGGTVFVVGEAGIGKSRLARELRTTAHEAGMLVVQGRAVETSSGAYRPLAEALCSVVRAQGVPETPELASFRGVLGRLIPEWRGEAELVGAASLVELGEAVLRFLRVVAAGRGGLVVLEDVHWADPETLMLMEYLADNLAAEPVLVVATVRSESRSPGLQLARRLEARRVASIVHLSRLDASAVADMVAGCLGSTQSLSEAVALVGVAEGVPFLVEEVLAATVASGALVHEHGAWRLAGLVSPVVPLTFADSVRRRVGPLGREGRVVLSAAAVLGRRFDWSLLPEVTALRGEIVVDALRAAVELQLVDPDDGGFRFRHALTRDAILHDLLPPERVELSRRALEIIETRWPTLPGDWCDLAAELADASQDRERAAMRWLEVGQRALRAGALASAERALTHARAVTPGMAEQLVGIEECLLDVLTQAGKTDEASTIGASLLTRLPADASVSRCRVLLRLGRAMADVARWQEAEMFLDEARDVVSGTDVDAFMAGLHALAARVAMGRHRLDVATADARAALAIAEQAGVPEVACEALEVIGRCARAHDLDAAEAAFAASCALAETNGMTVWHLRSLHELGTVDLLRDGGLERLEAARELATGVGALALGAMVDVQIAAVLGLSDDPEQTLIVAQRAAELARRFHLDATYAVARAFEAAAHARAGRADEMRRCVDDALVHAAGNPSIRSIPSVVHALLALRQEQRMEAIRHLDDGMVVGGIFVDALGDQSPPTAGVRALLRVVDAGSDAAAVHEARAAGQPVHFWARAYLGYADAVVLGRAGREEEAMAAVAGSDALLARFCWLRHLGRRLVAEAAIADGWGDPVGWLREALAFFDGRSERELASACRGLLRRAGAPVPRQRGRSHDVPASLRASGITGREFEVLRLLADGCSNRDIAVRLYLSPRTVERHVANLSVKTGVTSRAQLVALAARTLNGGSAAPD